MYSISDIRSEPKVIHNEYIRIRADEQKNIALTGGYISKIQWFFILFHFKSFNVFDNDVKTILLFLKSSTLMNNFFNRPNWHFVCLVKMFPERICYLYYRPVCCKKF